MGFSHIDEEGEVKMVDVSGKSIVKRTALAQGVIHCQVETLDLMKKSLLKKGDPIATARLAGIMAAKQTAHLIPLCHPLPIDDVEMHFHVEDDKITITSKVISTARTGVEMEALCAVSVAALTIYDMCKAVDKTMRIDAIQLRQKTKEPLA